MEQLANMRERERERKRERERERERESVCVLDNAEKNQFFFLNSERVLQC